MKGLPRLCGIFAANDYVGEEIINICNRLEIPVPDDIAVVGVDNDESVCENLSPTLSSLVPDFGDGGYQAAKLLSRAIAAPDLAPVSYLYPVARVEVRRSTRRIGCNRKRIADAVEMIRKMACNGISSADVVDFIGEPRRTAEAHFREVTGRSIHEEIDEIRFAKVFELLKKPSPVTRFASGSLRLQNRRGTPQGVQPPHRHVHARLAKDGTRLAMCSLYEMRAH